MRSVKLFLWLLLTVSFAACSTSSRSGPAGSSGGGTPKSGGSAAAAEETAVYNTIRDARLILRQPKANQTAILVNRDHADRRTREGRLNLAMGDLQQGYKPVSDRQFDSLLESFKTYKYQLIKEPWVPGDERYLRAKDGEIEGFRGIIVVENAGERYKLVQWRPAHAKDTIGQQKQQTFIDLKGLVIVWLNEASRVETADVAIISEDNVDPLSNRR